MDDNYTSHVLLLLLLLVAFGRKRFLGGAPPPALLKFWSLLYCLFKEIADNDFKRLFLY